MVVVFNVHRFTEQMVDTIEDFSAMTVTNHNKLLIAQSDYTIEVRDLLSEEKTPLFSFPTVDRVQSVTHCASGNYVATLEGKQTFQKSDVLIARVYTNWETDFVVSECKKSTKFVKRFMRARIAGVVTPSSTKSDEDYLDMIEIPVSYSTATIITCCQKTGRLLIASGSTIYLFQRVYLRSHNGKSPLFMDFVPLTQIFQLSFAPLSVTICENVITAHSHKMVSVFRFKKVTGNDDDAARCSDNVSAIDEVTDDKFDDEDRVFTEKGALHVNNVISSLKRNDEMKHFKILKNFLSPCSFPLVVHLKGVNDSLTDNRRTPFVILPPRSRCEIKNGKVEDNLVETHSSNKEMSVMAESLLALHISNPEDIILKTALQVLSHDLSTPSKSGMDSFIEQFCVGNEQFIGMNFLIATGQEGFLFYTSADKLQEGLEFVAIFQFTSPVVSVMFESCFLHVLTKSGIETFNVPTLRPIIFSDEPVLAKCTEWVNILGITPLIGVLDFAGSKDYITVFTTSADGKKGRESLPWTAYSLKLPKIYETYKEVEEHSEKFRKDNFDIYQHLVTEGYLMMQMALNFRLPIPENDNMSDILNHFTTSTKKLIKIYFERKAIDHTRIGTSIILASNINPMEIINELDNKDGSFTPHIMYLVKKWMSKNSNCITLTNAEWVIRILEENNEIPHLSKFLLYNETICRSNGHKAVPCLRKFISNSSQAPDVYTVFTLCVLYTQQCLQNEAKELLNRIKKQDRKFKKSFIEVAIENWKFLFESITKNNKEEIDFSEFTSVLIENLPEEVSQILTELMKKKILSLADIVQMLLKQFPCQVSMEKGHFVLQTFLESVFSQKIVTNANDPGVNNCLKILMRSYLTQLRAKHKAVSLETHESIFCEKLPEFVTFLPVVENCNYVALKKLQDLVWSKMLNEEAVREILEALPSSDLRLNVSAMLSSFDFVKELIKNNCPDAIFPYAKVCFSGVKKWRDLIILIQNHIAELKDMEHNVAEYEEIYDQTLDHLSRTMTPAQLNAVLEPIIPKKDDTYWKYIMKAQQISYANDVKELIINTSQQLLYSNSLY